EERVRDILVSTSLQETITYSLTAEEREKPLEAQQTDYIRLVNPISSERVVLRHSVLASVLEVAAANLRHTEDVRLFEIGAVYLPQSGEKLPAEPRRLAIIITGRRSLEFWTDSTAPPAAPLDFFDLKGVVDALAADLHLAKVSYRPSTAAYLHP